MEDDIELSVTIETSGENPLVIPISHSIDTVMEITCTEFDNSAMDKEADKQQSMEMSPALEEKIKNRIQDLFAPFSHHMKPDPEYLRLESERSTSDQEAATKIINDRYKLIMDNAARRKEKEQKDKIKFTQISHNVDLEKVMESYNMGVEDINKATQLLQNIHLTPGCLVKDKLEKSSDDHLEDMYWNSDFNRFNKTKDVQHNTNADILSIDILKSVFEDYEFRVEDVSKNIRNEQKDGGKKMTFYEPSGKQSSVKCQLIFGCEKEFVGPSFEEILDESLYEL